VRVQRLIAALEKTYKSPATRVPRLQLSEAYLALAKNIAKGRPQEFIRAALKTLESLGFVPKGGLLADTSIPFEVERWGFMDNAVIEVWIHLCKAYIAVAPHLYGAAKQHTWMAYKIFFGGDTTFDLQCGTAEEHRGGSDSG
jgi:hypothetical protein